MVNSTSEEITAISTHVKSEFCSKIPWCHTGIPDTLTHSDVSIVSEPGFPSVCGMDTLKLNCIFFFCNEHIAMQATRPWWLLRLERNGWAHSDIFLGPPEREKKLNTFDFKHQPAHTHTCTHTSKPKRKSMSFNFFDVILLYLNNNSACPNSPWDTFTPVSPSIMEHVYKLSVLPSYCLFK